MSTFTSASIAGYLTRADAAVTTADKGRLFEDLICHVFMSVPGISIAERNAMNAFETEETDIALWNDQDPNGLWFLPTVILVECKNWTGSVGSAEVAYFISRLEGKGRDFGILVAARGVSGSSNDLHNAHFELAKGLGKKIQVVVIERAELQVWASPGDIVRLLKTKLCQLAVRGTQRGA